MPPKGMTPQQGYAAPRGPNVQAWQQQSHYNPQQQQQQRQWQQQQPAARAGPRSQPQQRPQQMQQMQRPPPQQRQMPAQHAQQQQQQLQQQQQQQRAAMQQRQMLQLQQQQMQQEEAAAAAGAGEEEGGYYYYYQMPDGSWAYAPAGAEQQFSPVDDSGMQQEQQPAGYDEPAYGDSTGYQVVQGEDGNYYYYAADPSASQGNAQQQQSLPQQQQQQQVPQAMGVMGAGQPGQSYAPPADHKEMRKWQGEVKWKGEVCCSCWRQPCYCLGACVCPWCFVVPQRKKMLDNDWKSYTCCAGLCGPHMCECCQAGPCAMCAEALFCLPCAIHANRFMLMKRYNLRRTSCDNAVSAVSSCCFCCLCCDKAGWSRTACDWLYCLAYPCLITQHQVTTKRLQRPPELAGMK